MKGRGYHMFTLVMSGCAAHRVQRFKSLRLARWSLAAAKHALNAAGFNSREEFADPAGPEAPADSFEFGRTLDGATMSDGQSAVILYITAG